MQESAPSSQKGCSVHGGTREQLGGDRVAAPRRGLCSRERESNSAGPGALGTGDTAQDPAATRARQKPGGPRTARTLLPRDENISGPARSLQALQTESSGVTAEADSRAPELAPPLGLFLQGPDGVNTPH